MRLETLGLKIKILSKSSIDKKFIYFNIIMTDIKDFLLIIISIFAYCNLLANLF